MKNVLVFILFFIFTNSYSQEILEQYVKLNESFYQNNFASQINGKTEVVLDDKARVDIVTDSFAIEVDFAEKWAESIGQSLYYSRKLNKRAGILLIINPITDEKYLKRIVLASKNENITIWLWDYTTDKYCRIQTRIEYSYKF